MVYYTHEKPAGRREKDVHMFRKIIALLLCLLMCASAAAEGIRLDCSITTGGNTLSGSLQAGVTDQGALALTADDLGIYADDTHGLLVRNGDNWTRITALGMPLSLSGLTVMDATGLQLANAGAALQADLPVLYARGQQYLTNFMQDEAVSGVVGKLQGLMTRGSMTLTHLDLNKLLLAGITHFGTPLGIQAVPTARGIKLRAALANYPLFSGLQLTQMYDKVWSSLMSLLRPVSLRLPQDFTLTIQGSLSSGVISFTGSNLFVTLTYAADLSVMGYRFTVTGQLGRRAITAQGSIGGMGLNAELSVGGKTLYAQLVFGDSNTLSVQLTETTTRAQLFSLSAAMDRRGISLTMTQANLTVTAAMNMTGSSMTLGVLAMQNNQSIMSTPLLKLDASYMPGSFNAGCTAGGSTISLHAGWTAASASVQYTEYRASTA